MLLQHWKFQQLKSSRVSLQLQSQVRQYYLWWNSSTNLVSITPSPWLSAAWATAKPWLVKHCGLEGWFWTSMFKVVFKVTRWPFLFQMTDSDNDRLSLDCFQPNLQRLLRLAVCLSWCAATWIMNIPIGVDALPEGGINMWIWGKQNWMTWGYNHNIIAYVWGGSDVVQIVIARFGRLQPKSDRTKH